MPKRMSKKDRRVTLQYIKDRDGDICLLCFESPVRKPTIDHVNGRSRDNRLENLVLLCRHCNTAEGNRARRGQRALTPATLPVQSERAHEALANLNARRQFPAGPGDRVTVRVSERERDAVDRKGFSSTEETANLIMEPTYRLWLFNWVKKHGTIGKEDAIDAGAEYLDQAVGRASQQTVERYFRKAVSIMGWLEERRDASSKPVWGLRTGVSTEALEALLERRVKALGPAVPAEAVPPS